MPDGARQRPVVLLFLWLLLLCGIVSCAVKPEGLTSPPALNTIAYIPQPGSQKGLHRYDPVFVVEKGGLSYNRIGTPAAKEGSEDREMVYVDPSFPTVYFRTQNFTTCRDTYTNLIYRIHFSEVPCGPVPAHLTCGRNPGLLVYITLDSGNRPVLVTTLHTCGCYLAFIPTGHLDEWSYPEGWDTEGQNVYGEMLPGKISYPLISEGDGEKLVVRLRSETHRVMDVEVCPPGKISGAPETIVYRELPAEALQNLPLGDDVTSFFEGSGPRKGYVKGSRKPYERLLMSWWTLDWHIGEDKQLGAPENTGVHFYTSLKFWDRKESNIWFFDRFLQYWGWNL